MDTIEDKVLDTNNQQKSGKNELLECQTQLDDTKKKYLHLLADFENFKKRQEKERLQWARVAQIDVLAPLLTLIDDFDRALQQKQQTTSSEVSVWLEGFELIQKELRKYMDKIGIQEIKVSAGDSFNPELHESIMNVESELSPGSIVTVLQKGYTFKGSVLRPAKVSIAQ